MENADDEEPESKRRHLNTSVSSSPMARTSSVSPDDDSPVDAAVLQHQNQKLVQQLDAQKQELHVLEDKLRELKERQCSYDDTLIAINRLWKQLVDDLTILGVQAGANGDVLQALDGADRSRDPMASCPSEEIFLSRLLESCSFENNGETRKYVEEALSARHLATLGLMTSLTNVLGARRAEAKKLALTLHGKVSDEDAMIQQHKIDELMEHEAANLQKAINILRLKHKEYEDEIQTLTCTRSVDQSDIKRVAGLGNMFSASVNMCLFQWNYVD